MVLSHLRFPTFITTSCPFIIIRKQQLQYQLGSHKQRWNNADMLSHYGGICQHKNYYNFCYKLFCKSHKICKNWHFKSWDHLDLLKSWGPWDSPKENLFLYLAFSCVGLVFVFFFSSLFIIHRSKLAISGLWPLNPALPINFSFVSGSRYNFSESQISYQIMQQSWPVSKSWQKSVGYLESTPICFFDIDWFHGLYRAAVLRILFSLFCPLFISAQHTHTSFVYSVLQSCHTTPRPCSLGCLPIEPSSQSMLLTWDT